MYNFDYRLTNKEKIKGKSIFKQWQGEEETLGDSRAQLPSPGLKNSGKMIKIIIQINMEYTWL